MAYITGKDAKQMENRCVWQQGTEIPVPQRAVSLLPFDGNIRAGANRTQLI